MIKGVVSMPSNIFATTGTNVSIIFLDNTDEEEKAILVDASKLGKKIKEGKNQKTVLREDEIEKIIGVFTKKEEKEDFSVEVTYDQLKENNCSFFAGQYFDVKVEYVELTQKEFNKKMKEYKQKINKIFANDETLKKEILEEMEEFLHE